MSQAAVENYRELKKNEFFKQRLLTAKKIADRKKAVDNCSN